LPSGSTRGIYAAERAAIVLHHARLELAFADIARQAPQPDLSTVQAWYLRHQTQFMRPEQRLTRHLLLTVDGDREAVHQRILGLYRQINASRDALLRWPAAIPTAQAPWKRAFGLD
jgi:peptidyl-prolyl cis-trans isomerase C